MERLYLTPTMEEVKCYMLCMSRLKKLLIVHDTTMLADTSVKTKGGNFGVIADKTLSFAEYFNEISKKACFAHFLFDGLKLLTNSLIFS